MAESTFKKQHTIEYIAIGALVIVALIIGVSRFKKGDTDDEVFSRKEFNKKWKEVEILEANIPKNEKEAVYTVTEDGKAPFKSPFDEGMEDLALKDDNVSLPDMRFQGMVWKSSRPQAIINDSVYDIKDVIKTGAGATAEEVRVKDITKDGIHLIYKGKNFIVRPK